MLEYQHQESSQTLAEGLAEYCAAYGEHFGTRKKSLEAEEFFRCHDVAHIIFGCDISLAEEAVVKVSSALGTTAGFGVLRGYRLAESREVYQQLRWRDIALTALRSLVNVPKTIWRCWKMHKRWNWSEHDVLMGRPLRELRREYGIRVPR